MCFKSSKERLNIDLVLMASKVFRVEIYGFAQELRFANLGTGSDSSVNLSFTLDEEDESS